MLVITFSVIKFLVVHLSWHGRCLSLYLNAAHMHLGITELLAVLVAVTVVGDNARWSPDQIF
jgi:hypothetical protein